MREDFTRPYFIIKMSDGYLHLFSRSSTHSFNKQIKMVMKVRDVAAPHMFLMSFRGPPVESMEK